MTEQAATEKSTSSIPHNAGDLVLVKWNDGMVYFAKIKRIDHRQRKCVVVFDDKSTDEADFSQIHSGKSRGPETQPSVHHTASVYCLTLRNCYASTCAFTIVAAPSAISIIYVATRFIPAAPLCIYMVSEVLQRRCMATTRLGQACNPTCDSDVESWHLRLPSQTIDPLPPAFCGEQFITVSS